jgi:hypothetical protein
MRYEDITVGQKVKIVVPHRSAVGTVKRKAIERKAGRLVERVYIDTERGTRRVCDPGVLRAGDAT